MNFWHGKSVKLRGVEPSDAEIFFQWNQNSERARRLDFVWPPTSRAAVETWVEEQSQKKLEKDAFIWVIEDMDGVAVGSISTHHCDLRNRTFSYAVDIAPENQRRGYASEAILLVLKYYFEESNYQKVAVPVHSYNRESMRLHKKLGFKKEGTLRRMVFSGGEYADLIWYGMTREEFQRSVPASRSDST
jgi:RimJ/RimL family protein N-acetyltransferase